MSTVNEWQHLKIPFDEIQVATENFKTFIGRGGYGSVFKGKLLVSGKETMVAVKRLNEQFGQGLKEFLTEIQLLSGQQHPNLISLVGFCDEGREKSIVYEYAARGSLDQYIRRTRKTTSTTLTWLQRLKICVDAACGLDYLHRHVGGHRTIIHRDIKSSNILIDENWVAKISDFGLSKLSVTGFGMSHLVTKGCGTPGYCEPEYNSTGVVTKKSDVYSFGVVLFEVLCGRLCLFDSDDGFSLSSKSAKYHYKKNSLDKIMDDSLREHMGSYSMTKFAAIAYGCLHDDRQQRPAMDVVLKELEEALKYHEEYEFRNVEKSKSIVAVKDDKKSKNIAVVEDDTDEYWDLNCIFQEEYEFRNVEKSKSIVAVKDDKKSKNIAVVEDDTDEYWDLNCIFQDEYEFQNGKKSKSPVVVEDGTDEYWETKLPEDLDSLIKMFKIPIRVYTIKKELFSYLHQGTLFDRGNKFFWISDEGNKCLLTSSSSFISSKNHECLTWESDNDSRFKVVAHYSQILHNVKFRIKTSMLSLGTMYEASLVFKDRWATKPVRLIRIKWKTNDLIVCSTHVAQWQFDKLMRIKMWRFWNHVPNAEFDIVIDEFPHAEGHRWDKFWIEGIEFQPVKMESISFLNKDNRLLLEMTLPSQHGTYEHEGFISLLDDNDDNDEDDDEYWEKKLPQNYQCYIEMSDKPLDYATKKELYLLFCGGFLADNGQLWFSMCKSTHGICSLLSANKISSDECRPTLIPLYKSRFGLVTETGNVDYFWFETTLDSFMFSPQYTYACYLLFKFRNKPSIEDDTVLLETECELDGVSIGTMFIYRGIYLSHIPTIKPKNDYGLHDSSNILKAEALAVKKDRTEHLGYARIEERKDGWMEAMLFKPTNQLLDHSHLTIDLWESKYGILGGLIIEGIEFRPYT